MKRQLSVFVAVFLSFGAAILAAPASLANETAATEANADAGAIQLEEISTRTKPSGDTELEEITVFGKMSTSRLAIQFKEAQWDFLDLYNSLNTNDEFKVICEKRTSKGSNFKKTRCEPAYYKEAAAEAFQNSVAAQSVGRNGMNIGDRPPGPVNFNHLTRGKQEEAIQHMIGLVENNPELRRKYNELVKKQLAYERSKAAE